MSASIRSIVGDVLNAVSRPAPVILGSVTLEGHEAPARIAIGGKQAFTMHKLPGGGRIIDAMGPDENSVAWRGLFVGPNAATRVRLLNAMRTSGVAVDLSFGDYQFSVFVVGFEYSYQDRGAVIAYRIQTEIVPDGTASPIATPTTLQSVISDCSFAVQLMMSSNETVAAYAGSSALPTVLGSDLMSRAVGTLQDPSGSLNLVADSAGAPAAGSTDIVNDAAVKLSGVIAGVSTGHFAGASSTLSVAGGSELAAMAVSSGVLAGAVRAGGYLNRALASIAADSAAIAVPVIHA